MIRKSKVNLYNEVKVVDTFLPAVMEVNKGDDKQSREVNIYFGANMDTLVITARNKQLSKDNLERIRILTDVR